MAEETTTTEAPEAPETAGKAEEGSKAPDGIDRLLERFEGFEKDVSSRLSRYEEALTAPFEEEQEEQEGAAPGVQFNQADYDEQGQIRQEAAERELARIIDQRVEERIRPLNERANSERVTREADAIESKYPELRDEKVATETVALARAEAERIGRPELGGEPAFLEMVYLAAKAREKTAQESPGESGREVRLEGAGGAAAGEEPEDDTADRIVNLAQGRRLFK